MPETLTRGEAQNVMSNLKDELRNIRSSIKSEGIFSTSLDFLKSKEKLIQDKLNDIMKKGGVVTEDDYNDTFNLIRAKSEKEILNLKKRAVTDLYVFVGIAIAVGVTIYLLLKNDKNA